MSKAWYACDEWEGTGIAVFADTRSKARKYIWENKCNFDLNFDRYIDIKPRRAGCLDYLDKPDGYVMDFNNLEERIALVRYCGWYCLEPDYDNCPDCPAKDYCDEYADWRKENEQINTRRRTNDNHFQRPCKHQKSCP